MVEKIVAKKGQGEREREDFHEIEAWRSADGRVAYIGDPKSGKDSLVVVVEGQ